MRSSEASAAEQNGPLREQPGKDWLCLILELIALELIAQQALDGEAHHNFAPNDLS
jgi:hypothetical protein